MLPPPAETCPPQASGNQQFGSLWQISDNVDDNAGVPGFCNTSGKVHSSESFGDVVPPLTIVRRGLPPN